MAGKKLEYQVEVDASDATSELKKLGDAGTKAGQALSKGLAKGAADAGRDIDGLLAKVEKLGAGKATNLLLTNNFKEIENDIVDLTIKLNELDANDPEVDVTVAQLGQLQGDLDTVTAKIRELNSTDAVIEVTADTSRVQGALDGARGKTDDLTDSANKSRNAFANMVGNAAQDLGAFAGIAGSAGVAVGQLAEGAADARNSGEGLGSVLKGVAGSALPIAAIGIGVGLIASQMQKSKERAAQLRAEVGRFTSGLQETIGAGRELDAVLDSAFEVGAASEAAIVAREFQNALDPSKLDAYRTALSELAMTNEQFVSELQLAGGTYDWFVKRQAFAASGNAAVADQVAMLVENFDGYTTILGSAEGETADFIRTNEQFITGLDDMGNSLGALDLERLAENFLNAQRGTASETRLVNEAVDATNNYTDALDKYLQLKQRQNALDAAARTGLAAQVTMWDSIAQANTEAAAQQEELTFSSVELADALKAMQDPLDTLPATWQVLIANFKDGQFTLENAEVLINRIAAATNLAPGDVLNIVAEKASESEAALEKTATAMDHVASAAGGFAGAEGDVASASQATADALNAQADALQAIIDKRQAMIDATDDLAAAQQEWDDQLEAFPGIVAETSKAMDESTEGSDEWVAARNDQRDALESLTDQFVTTTKLQAQANGEDLNAVQIQEARAEGLARVAGTLDDRVIPAVAAYYSGILKIPENRRTEFETVLARGDQAEIEAFIAKNSGTKKLAIQVEADEAKLAKVDTAVTALTAPKTVPVTAEAHTATAKEQLNGLKQLGVTVPVGADTSSAKSTVDRFRSNEANTPIYIKVAATTVGGGGGGYSKPAPTTLAAPLALTPGPTPLEGEDVAVTPYADTVAVASFGTPVSVAGPSFTPTVHNHVTISAAVIGSRFDVQRAVSKALRQAQRINGVRV